MYDCLYMVPSRSRYMMSSGLNVELVVGACPFGNLEIGRRESFSIGFGRGLAEIYGKC
jgi:hypothetical protein